jgi:hypothetical protein
VICGNDMVLEDSFGTQSVMQDFLPLIMQSLERHCRYLAFGRRVSAIASRR